MPGFFKRKARSRSAAPTNLAPADDCCDLPHCAAAADSKSPVGRAIRSRIELLGRLNRDWEDSHGRRARGTVGPADALGGSRAFALEARNRVRFREVPGGGGKAQPSAGGGGKGQSAVLPRSQSEEAARSTHVNGNAAPLATVEMDDFERQSPRPAARAANGLTTHAVVRSHEIGNISHYLVRDDHSPAAAAAAVRDDTADSATPVAARRTSGIVFLQFADETKRAILPKVSTVDDVRQIFLRAFPQTLSAEFLYSPTVRVYIQDPAKLDVFYELEDMGDVRDRSVLRLREQAALGDPFAKPFGAEDDINYYSESELDMPDWRLRRAARPLPPPSVSADRRRRSAAYYNGYRGRYSGGAYGSTESGSDSNRSPPRPPVRSVFRSASDGHASGFENAYSAAAAYGEEASRSGSVTPVIDEQARLRMSSMEQELASLSSLVHSALMNKGVSESVFKDIEMLRREILGGAHPAYRPIASDLESGSDAGSVSRFSDLSSDKGSSVHEQLQGASEGELKRRLRGMKFKVGELHEELKHLRRIAQVNAQCSRDMLRDSFEKIRAALAGHQQHDGSPLRLAPQRVDGAPPHERIVVDEEKERHQSDLTRIEHSLSSIEVQVELLRQNVVDGRRKLRIGEVEQFTRGLTEIGRTAAALKTRFPSLQHHLKMVMGAEMEKVVREEKFLKEEPMKIDNALRRCKKLTNVMITMKKLAHVQDAEHSAPPTAVKTPVPPVPPVPSGYSAPTLVRDADFCAAEPANDRRHHSPKRAHSQPATADGHHVLDTLLEELQTVGSDVGAQARPTAKECEPVAARTMERRATDNGAVGAPPWPRRRGIVEARLDERPVRLAFGPTLLNGGGSSRSRSPPYEDAVSEQGDGGRRSRSNTPTSVSSEPAAKPPVPPPPASYYGASNGASDEAARRAAELSVLKGQLAGRPPMAIAQTNALVDEDARWVKSASSSESVNSQEGQAFLDGQTRSRAPPPPPPPRNRQELIEQRQQELMDKQRYLRARVGQLQDMRQYPPPSASLRQPPASGYR